MSTRIAIKEQLQRKLRSMGQDPIAERIATVRCRVTKGVRLMEVEVFPREWTKWFKIIPTKTYTTPRNVELAAVTLLAVV